MPIKEKADSDDEPKSLLEKLIAQKKNINDKMNELQKHQRAGELQMTNKQVEEMVKELTVQLKAVDQSIVMENDRIRQELKDTLKDQQGKKQEKAGKKENLSAGTESMTAKEIVAKNTNQSILSASGGLNNLKLVNHVNRSLEQRKDILEGEFRLSLMNGGSIEGKMDELNELNKKRESLSNEFLDIALAPLKDIILKEKKAEEEKVSTEVPEISYPEDIKDLVDVVTQIEPREMSSGLPDNMVNDINYFV